MQHRFGLLAILLYLCGCASTVPRPLIIAHRGASLERQEETLAADQLAIDQGADFIELDLVPTKDGQLIARHENNLSETTDIAAHPEFASRHTTKIIDGKPAAGWFSEDFTLAELKMLKTRERLPALRPQNIARDGQYPIATLDEVIDFLYASNRMTGHKTGLYIETKHPSYFAALGFDMEAHLAQVLEKHRYQDSDYPIFLESFEPSSLKKLHQLTPYPCIQLIEAEGKTVDTGQDFSDMLTPQGLKEIATYAVGIGPDRHLIVPEGANGNRLPPTTLVNDAHKAGLVVHIWTLRPENTFLPRDLWHGDDLAAYGDFSALLSQLAELSTDGIFTDAPEIAIKSLSADR